MEMMMLYDVRKDAIEKLSESNPEGQTCITDAIATVIEFAQMVQRDGILSLEEMAQCVESEYVKLLVILAVDGTDPEWILEIGTNEYWSQVPQGTEAMVYYIYLRGILMIQAGINLWDIKSIFWTLLPEKWRQPSPLFQEVLDRVSEELEKKREMISAFSNIHPTFEKTELSEKLSALEKKVITMDNESIQRVLREVDINVLVLERCLYGFRQEPREKIMNNLSVCHSYIMMANVVFLEQSKVEETDILAAVMKMNDAIDRLYDAGVIFYQA